VVGHRCGQFKVSKRLGGMDGCSIEGLFLSALSVILLEPLVRSLCIDVCMLLARPSRLWTD